MKQYRVILYLLFFVFTISIIIGTTFSESFEVDLLLDNTSSKGVFFGLNSFLRSFLSILTSILFYISYQITYKQKDSEKKRYFYLTQIFFWAITGLNVRFHFIDTFFDKQSSLLIILLGIQIAIFLILGEIDKFRASYKKKIYICLFLSIVQLLLTFILPIDSIAYKISHTQFALWIDLVFMVFAWDIMYSKVKKLKNIANKYYREQKLKKREFNLTIEKENQS